MVATDLINGSGHVLNRRIGISLGLGATEVVNLKRAA
jgi:hypothetical protein